MSLRNGTNWCDRMASRPLHYYGLCLSEADFDKTLKALKIRERPQWISGGANATTHSLSNNQGERLDVVCIDTSAAKVKGVGQVYSLLVHEAVHIWQHYCEDIGELSPSVEFEAYTIQRISQELLYAYDDVAMRKLPKKKPSK